MTRSCSLFMRLLPLLFLLTWTLRGQLCQAVGVTVLHTFGAATPSHGQLPSVSDPARSNPDGALSLSALILGRDGVLYGTTTAGGPHGTGVIFKVNPDGTGFTLLHSFETVGSRRSFGLIFGTDNGGGASPGGPLVQTADGTLYGAAEIGGSAGTGVIFEIRPDGTGFRVIHKFGRAGDWATGRNVGGASPTGLTLAADGLLYGTAQDGGTDGGGVVFRLRRDGAGFQVLHAFRGIVRDSGTNEGGAQPEAAPVFGRDGALYGTTGIGGSDGCGVIYRMTSDGRQFAVLHHFQRQGPALAAGSVLSEGSLTPSADGFLYGSTRQGGADGSSTLFKIGQAGTGFTILHSFSGFSDDGDGRLPAATPILGRDGRLYGLTGAGGANGVGTLFWASMDGSKFAVIHDFDPPDDMWHNTDGAYPRAGLLQGPDGALYGMAAGGGPNGSGTVFRLLPPPAR